ncbi:uncharacterized protein LOC120457333 [Drosophila santomea]|uniref:uncharacterized protein LOC120457333 n=1 Tax=Drosophila santomea TaxID=129105 RepID=UPI001953686F|nr:uncharacterized protein LOC120457333 [Drosophila santomea]
MPGDSRSVSNQLNFDGQPPLQLPFSISSPASTHFCGDCGSCRDRDTSIERDLDTDTATVEEPAIGSKSIPIPNKVFQKRFSAKVTFTPNGGTIGTISILASCVPRQLVAMGQLNQIDQRICQTAFMSTTPAALVLIKLQLICSA